MNWTKLAYGTVVATAMLAGGVVVYYNHENRPATSVVTAEHVATLIEGTLERSAAVSDWPFTTNATTTAGWSSAVTNLAEARDWNFNFYSTIPLLASVNPRQAMVETLAQIKAIVPSYVDYINPSNHVPVMLTVTGVWARLGIGDHTNKWTVGVDGTTNHYPVYGTNVGSTLSTTTLNEAWAVLNACTTTARIVTYQTWSNYVASVNFTSNAYDIANESRLDYCPEGTPYDPDPVHAGFIPPASVLDWAEVAARTTYSLSEVGDFALATNAGAGGGGEWWLFNTEVQGADVIDVWITTNVDYLLRLEHVFVSWSSQLEPEPNILLESTNKILALKSALHYSIAMPSFPSGVVAAVSLTYAVTGTWSAGEITLTNYDEEWGVHTNYAISGTVTKPYQTVVFSNALATSVYTRVAFEIAEAMTNWLPADLQTYSIPHMIQDVTNLDARVVGNVETWQMAQAPLVSAKTEDGATSGDAPVLRGHVYQAGDVYAIFNWTFKYK